jgi:hypothetical protein
VISEVKFSLGRVVLKGHATGYALYAYLSTSIQTANVSVRPPV